MTDYNVKHPKLRKGYLDYDFLLGKQFIHGETDCYTLLQDLFKNNLGITLNSYAHPDDWWIDDDMDLYMDNFKNEGFVLVEDVDIKDLRILDVLLICIPDPRKPDKTKTNHCAVYVGEGYVVHHRLGKLSQRSPYRGMLRNFTTAVIRHKDVPDLLSYQKQSTIDLMDYLPSHKREQILGAQNERTPNK